MQKGAELETRVSRGGFRKRSAKYTRDSGRLYRLHNRMASSAIPNLWQRESAGRRQVSRVQALLTPRQLLSRSYALGRAFYQRPTVEVARELLGKILIHRAGGHTLAGRIVETEAYLGQADQAAHTARGLTKRTQVIFGPPGHAYVYLCYGMYECLNLVAEPDGVPGCVLIRALEPLCGIDEMQRRRPKARRPRDLASGPGKLTLAMGITREHNGADITRGAFSVRSPRRHEPFHTVTTTRVGIQASADLPLRFYIRGNEYVSVP
jgi:DNA-3-methyladenine glycosylase